LETSRGPRLDFQEIAMASSWIRNHRHEPFPEDDYRAWLISRNPPPIVYHSCGIRLARLRVRFDRLIQAVDRGLHRMIEALERSKMRRIERELQLRGIRYSQSTDEGGSARP
jgi:hypothetical protein